MAEAKRTGDQTDDETIVHDIGDADDDTRIQHTSIQPAADDASQDELTERPEAGESGSTRRLVSAGALMAAGTMTSRVLGFVRVALLAFLIGNGTRQADIYDIASMVPTSLYILFAGGALNTVLVPQLVRAVKNDDDNGEAYTNRIMTAFGLIVAAIALISTLGTPIIVGRIYASDQWLRPEMAAHLESMLFLGYLFLPQIFLYGVFFLIGQILNARDHFGPMMWAPVVNNIVQIGVLGIYLWIYGTSDGAEPFTPAQGLLLGGGATFGIACQTLVMLLCLRRAGYRYKPRFDLKGTGLGHTFSLAKWTLGFVLVNQLALVVVTRLATAATVDGAGAGIAAYNKAYLIFVLPHSLVTVSLATAMLPSASRLAASGDMRGVARETMRTLRLVTAVLLPAAVALLALGDPITRLMFGNGLGAADAQFVGWTLRAFALGLLPFTLQYVCLRAFYALENTKITFYIQVLIASVQVSLALALVVPFHNPSWVAPALAVAFASAYTVGFFVSFHHLHRHLPHLRFLELARQVVRVTAAILPAGLLAWGASVLIGRWDASKVMTLGILGVTGLVAVALYLLCAHVLRIGEVTEVLRTILRRGGRTPATAEPDESLESKTPGTRTAVADAEVGTRPVTSQVDDEESLPDALLDPAGGAWHGADEDFDEDDAEQYGTDHFDDADDESVVSTVIRPAFDPNVFDQPSGRSIHASPGQSLAGRYMLEETLSEQPETQSWVATDQVLSRPVMLYLLPRGDGRNDELLEAARRSAIATDARFLRVLDASGEPAQPDDDAPDGPFVVCEYAAGETLASILAHGPMSALEAGWLTREVADALAGMHAQGMYHERISPESIVITPTGNVKIVGFGIQSVLEPPTNGSPDPAQADVHDVGRVLYATLAAHYPGGPAHGLPAVPVGTDGAWLTPRDVRPGVSPALDRICEQILSERPRSGAPLQTMSEIGRALTRVLGTADASTDLERRLRNPATTGPTSWGEDDTDWGTEHTQPVAIDHAPIPASLFADASDDDSESTSMFAVSDAGNELTDDDPTPDAGLPVREEEPSRRWLGVLLAIVAVIALISLFAVFGRGQEETEPQVDSPSAPTEPIPAGITGATDFDPQGRDQQENPDLVPQAHDGDPETAWETVVYRNPDMAPKDGVGVNVQLDGEIEVTKVELMLVGDGTDLEIRVPDGDQWRTIGSADDAGRDVTIDVPPTRTGEVQVWLKELPSSDQGGYLGGIAEISVLGHR